MTVGNQASLTIEEVARYPRPGMATPARWGFTPDDRSVTYLWSEESGLVLSLWEFDIDAGKRRLLAGPGAESGEQELSREEILRRERLRLRELGVTDYHWGSDANPPVLLVPSGEGARVRVGDGEFVGVDGTAGSIDQRLSPDGTQLAFVRESELHVVDVAEGSVRQLTGGAEPGLTHGLADFIAQEEFDRTAGYWWSGDGCWIAFEEADTRHIPRFRILHDHRESQDEEGHEYPFAGEPNALVRLGIVHVGSGATTWVEVPGPEDSYLVSVNWRSDGALVVTSVDREQKRLFLHVFEAQDWSPSLLLEEKTEPWINIDHALRFLPDGSFVRTSETSGFRHLYLYSKDGSVQRPLTEGDWVVTNFYGIDEAAGLAYFQSTRESPLERHIYSVPLNGGEVKRLTPEAGWHAAVFGRSWARFIDVHSSMDTAPAVRLRSASDGNEEAILFDNDGTSASGIGLCPPKLVSFPLADGTLLHGALYEPPGQGSGQLAPLVVSVYGGPHAQRVIDEWSMTVDLRAQYLAQRGYAVFKLDNRGSANRGLGFEAPIDRAMGTIEIEDQVAGVRFLEGLGSVDTSRVGIFGWSYGGYVTCLALMKRPDVFSVGVAGAPVADWDGYDTGYTERYMGTPQDNPNGYREGSALTHAHGLAGRLLLVHGLVDENVHFRHTVRLVGALTEEQKEYDLMVFPGERHMPRAAPGLEYMERRLFDYFDRHLMGSSG